MQTVTAAQATGVHPGAGSTIESANTSSRFAALDIFRGLTIAGMILVNTPGSWDHVYAPLLHARWHGLTPTDLVFPFFLFVTGCAMWFSFRKFEHRPSKPVLGKVARRVALIFLVGLALNAFPFVIDYGELRIPGVLQRIALAYGAGALLCLYLPRTRLLWASAGLLVGYWLLLLLFGGDDPFGLETDLVRRIDLFLLGADHVYHGYQNAQGVRIPFDPEGLLSTLPAIVTVVGGFLTGQVLGTSTDRGRALRSMALWGGVAIAAGLLWGLVFPINKPIWTSTYVLVTGGLGAIGLALVTWIVDLRGYRRWAFPFLVFGMNPLFAYVLSGLVSETLWMTSVGGADGSRTSTYTWLYTNVFAPAGAKFGSLLFALSIVAVCWAVVYVLYRRRIFIKL